MKKILLISMLVGLGALAQAQETPEPVNYCTYGDKVLFADVTPSPGRTYSEYRAVLSDKLVVRVTRSFGHVAIYYMAANYNNGQVVINDRFADFCEPRPLHISGSVEGKILNCVFNTN